VIRLINIKNFRSIQDQAIKVEELTTFVGNNDAGKSNILRALNLFFNGETDSKVPFNFKSDFNINAKVYKQRAKEITIELGLKLPSSYRRDRYPDTVYWKKVWRESGEHDQGEEIKFCSLENDRFSKKTELPSKSRIISLLKNVNYIYVPAIKDKLFFVELQGKIYDVLAQATENGLHISAKTFEEKIQHEFNELLNAIDSTFENSNSISLPQNMRGIFENLEFSSGRIPLTRRGDGIKVRHIPAMLRFIGEKSSSGHKTLIAPQIWGFEEPENNVEFSSCFALSQQFIEAAKNKTQVILTTHSPAIYSIADKVKTVPKVKAARFYVTKSDESNSTELNEIDDQEIHQKIGFMPLIAPLIAEKEELWRASQIRLKASIEKLESDLEVHNQHRIFVEGASDKAILTKAINIYSPELAKKVYFELTGNNSANSAMDRAKAFYLVQKHKKPQDKLKAILLLDNDEKGRECKREIDEFLGSSSDRSILRIELIKKAEVVIGLKKDGFNIDADLESCFPEAIWTYALEKGWLIEIEKNADKFTPSKISIMFNDGLAPDELIASRSSYEQLLINYKFTYDGKENLSKYIDSLSTDEILRNGVLNQLAPIVSLIDEYLK
jgi:AAA15 family ATPase/GTPase/5S rRNA maturation endonuclease (ribonuclease M5)